jgi:hypothetical protein
MSITAVNLKYIGPPGSTAAPGQIYNSTAPGPLGKEIIGYGTAVLDGSSTSFTVNFIDGVQELFQLPVTIALNSATLAATVNGVANQTIYQGVGAMSALTVGQSVTIAGFANSGNNGTFTVNVVTANTIVVTNSSGVAETNYAATLSYEKGPVPFAIQITRTGVNGSTWLSQTLTADTAAATVQITGPSAVTVTGFTANLSAAGSSAATVGFTVRIIPSI